MEKMTPICSHMRLMLIPLMGKGAFVRVWSLIKVETSSFYPSTIVQQASYEL